MIDRRAVAVAGHTGDVATAEAGARAHDDPGVRATALGALDRLGVLDDDRLQRRRSPTPTPACAGAPSSSPPRARASTCAGRSPTPTPTRRRGGGVGVRRARGRRRRRAGDARRRWPAAAAPAATRSCARPPSPRSGRSATTAGSTRSSPPRPTARRSAAAPCWRSPRSSTPTTTGPPRSPRRSSGPPTDRDWQVRQAAEDVAPSADRASSGRRWSRGARSRCAGRAGWRPRATAGSSG